MPKVIVDGVETEISEEELIKGYQKGASADAKFQDAANIKKEAEGAMAVQEAMKTLKTDPGNEVAFTTVARAQGWEEAQITHSLQEFRQTQMRAAIQAEMGQAGTPDPEDEGDEEGDATPGPLDVKAVAMEVAKMIGPAMQQGIQKNLKINADNLEPRLHTAVMNVIGKNLTGTLQSAVDNDEYLGRFDKWGSSDQKEELSRAVTEEAQRRAARGEDPHSAKVREEVLQTVSDRMQKYGVRPERSPVPSPGLGKSGSTFSAIHPDKPIERSKDGNADPRFDENLTNRIMQAVATDVANSQ